MIAMYFIGDKQNLFGSTFEAYAIFEDVNGLQKGNNIRFSGINVGTVDDIEIINSNTVLVTMSIQSEVQKFIKKDAVVSVGTDGLMGNKLINISSGSLAALSIEENDTLKVKQRIDFGLAYQNLENTNANVSVISNDLVDIMTNIQSGKGILGQLISDSLLAQDVQLTLVNLKHSTMRAERILHDVEKTINAVDFESGVINALLTDTALVSDLRRTIADLSVTAGKTKEASMNLKLLATEIQSGNGMAGKIISDTLLSGKLEESLEHIRNGTKAFNENMEALKHHALFRRYFKKQEKEALKNNE